MLSTTITKAEDAAGAVDGMINVQSEDSTKKANAAASAEAITDINKMVKVTTEENKAKLQAVKDEKKKEEIKAAKDAAEAKRMDKATKEADEVKKEAEDKVNKSVGKLDEKLLEL